MKSGRYSREEMLTNMGVGCFDHASKVAFFLPTPIKYENEWREMGCVYIACQSLGVYAHLLSSSKGAKMSKIRVTPELVLKAKKCFSDKGEKGVKVNEGLTRSELRALERKGLVEKQVFFSERKWANVAPTRFYVYQWKGDDKK